MRDVSKVDTNLFAFFDFAAEAVGKPRVRQDGYSYVDLRPSPWGKAVYDLDFTAGDLPASLSQGIVSQRIPNRIRVGPTSRPAEVEELLREAGFVIGRTSRGMVLESGRRTGQGARPATVGLDLRILSSENDFADFANVVVANLFCDKSETSAAYASLLRTLDPARAFGFLGRSAGEPVTTAFGFIDGEGIGGVYFVATETAARGRGYGSAVVSAALDELGRRGASLCILQASELGKPVYEALGFVDAGPLPIYSLPGS